MQVTPVALPTGRGMLTTRLSSGSQATTRMGIVSVALLGGFHTLIAGDEQQVHVEADKLARQLGQAVEIVLRISGLDSDFLALDIAQFTQRLQECLIHRI